MKTAVNPDRNWQEKRIPEIEPLVARIGERARNLYLTRQMLCSEAVVTTLNQGLNGGLTQAQAVAMAAPFSEALGGSGCLCGALGGAVMAAGLFVGNDRPYGSRRGVRDSARQIHDAFKAIYGATCCRVLSRKVSHDSGAHFRQCADLTAGAAELAARFILLKRPDLMKNINIQFLAKRPSKIEGVLLRLFHHFSH